MANIGIDLGTTNSLVAVVLDGEVRVLPDDEGRVILPSVVRVDDDGGGVVGWEALAGAVEHAERTITSVKRFMGRSLAEARKDAEGLHYQLAEGDDRVVRVQVGRQRLTPIEISAAILNALKMRAEEHLFGRLGGAVITVPAYFDDAQRQATRDAARLCGLNVLRLLNEPTAAAVAYGLQNAQKGTWAVYDLGGGTFDVSILELADGVFQVLSTAGDTHLGGDDFDQALASRLLAEAGQDGAGGAVRRAAVEAAERAKVALSEARATLVDVQLGPVRVHREVTRDELDALIAPTVARTEVACRQALSDAELTVDQLDGVVLVGGSTRVPLVRDTVRRIFGKEPLCELDPDQVVAIGAAIQADILSGESSIAEDLVLLDILPLSLGLETMGGVVERLLFRCTPIPASASETFTTHVDGQGGVDLHVVQGERELAADCRSLARFKLTGIPAMPAGLPRVQVDFTVDANGILTVSAEEKYTGTSARIEVQPSYGLDEDEIERMLEDSLDHAETDVDQRMLIEARVEADGILAAVRKALAVDPSLLLDGEAERIGGVVAALEQAMAGTERHPIQDLARKLDEVTAPFAQRRIERDLQLALQGRHAEEVAEHLDRSSRA